MTATQYEIERHLEEGVVILTPTGPMDEMDLETQFAYAARFVDDHPTSRGAVFNLALVTRLASKAIGMIADLASRLEESGRKLVLAHADAVADALHICGIDSIIASCATLASAKKEVAEGPAAVPAKPASDDASVSFFSTKPSASSVTIENVPVAEAETKPAPRPEPTPKADPSETDGSPLFSYLDAPKAAQAADVPAQDPLSGALFDAAPVPEAPKKAPPAAKKAVPAAAAPSQEVSLPDADAAFDGGLVADPDAQMRSVLKDAAARLREGLSGFDARREDLEDALAAKNARIAAFQSESKALKAESKGLEKEIARAQAALDAVKGSS